MKLNPKTGTTSGGDSVIPSVRGRSVGVNPLRDSGGGEKRRLAGDFSIRTKGMSQTEVGGV